MFYRRRTDAVFSVSIQPMSFVGRWSATPFMVQNALWCLAGRQQILSTSHRLQPAFILSFPPPPPRCDVCYSFLLQFSTRQSCLWSESLFLSGVNFMAALAMLLGSVWTTWPIHFQLKKKICLQGRGIATCREREYMLAGKNICLQGEAHQIELYTQMSSH